MGHLSPAPPEQAAQPHGYLYDVFLSYRRSGAGGVADWVRNHFHPMLTACLADQLPREPSIFIDLEQQHGAHWPDELARALRCSKVLVPVWSPKYFSSPWCNAEWQTMLDRERAVGLAGPDQPQGLIYPVVFSDGDLFPDLARQRQARDFKPWAVPQPVYRETTEYVDLQKAVTNLAIELAPRLEQVPRWNPAWKPRVVDPPFPPRADPPRLDQR